ncbi:MAG: TonB-dependent receptor plug domain-containing protein, partial [Saprospiraceae bacterium]|nr:TonB-dependent receptor plug domain-containing protein [Saprospiraceae bacterium]
VGRQAIRFSYLGYETQTIPNVLVTAGKELLLQIKLEETFTAINEVVISAQSEKDKTVNELATISARQFNTEEVSRYSGGRNDVSKLVANFAGVAATNDARNDIVIRGNSPTGVLWRLEGIPIPSPNHYSTLGTTGGPVSALNPNMIGNSDFLTSAFPAEYGNATAGVFDIHLRQGNRDRYEFMGQVGAFTGFEGAIEGPIRKGKGSMVVAYRHSFAEVASAAGLNVGTTATPKYKDLTFNLDFGKTAIGNLSLFGIGGYSTIDFLGAEIDTTDLFANPDENAYNISKFGVIGLKNSILLNDHAYIRTILTAAHSGNTYKNEDLVKTDETGALLQLNDVLDATNTFRLSSYYNNKINRNLTLRAGILTQTEYLDSYVKTRDGIGDFDGDGRPDLFTQRDINGRFDKFEAYAQTQWRMSPKWTLNTGLHALYFNPAAVRTSGEGDLAVEPRVAVNWQVTVRSRLNAGYGMHHQTQPLPVFLFRQRQPDGSALATNTDLGFTRSQHFVLGWDYKPASAWRIKTEVYYQLLNNVPIDSISSTFSLLNTGADFVFPEKNNLVNEGTGYNTGLELTVEKFFNRDWYSLITVSLYDSKYKGSDDISRNTAFNGRYVFNVLAGKEFKLGKSGRRVFTLDTKFTTAGGRPYTPVDLAARAQAGREVLIEKEAYSLRLDDYLRWDVKMGVRMNSAKRKLSQTFFLDFQNVTNNQNIFAVNYNKVRNEIGKTYQIGFFPDVMYRIEF